MKQPKLLNLTWLLITAFLLNSTCFAEPAVTASTSHVTTSAKDRVAINIEEESFIDDDDAIEIADPFEAINRKIFIFNDNAYVYVIKPVAKRLRSTLPEDGRVAINNFFSNLLSPVRIVNATLQLKGEDAINEIFRLIINSTLGLAGLFDVAKNDFKITIKKEDFGQTLGYYKVANGPFIMLPLLGPSTLRDGVGIFVDGRFLDPLNHIYNDKNERYLLAKTIEIGISLSLDKDTYEAIKKNSLDPYLFLRDAYIQHRSAVVEK